MIKKENRVKRQEDFQEIIQGHKLEKSKSFIIYYQKNNLNRVRVGVSVSKKIGNAIKRNKIKRQVRHILHDLIDISKPVDLIVIVRINYENNTFSEKQKLMTEMLNKIWRKIDED